MSFGSFEETPAQMMAEINTTPLIDVMLVLLVVFLITLPMTTASVPVSLPKAQSTPTSFKPAMQEITIDGQGRIFWGDQASSVDDMDRRFAGIQDRRTTLRLRIDAAATFDIVAKVLAAANRHQLARIEFITEQPIQPN